MKQLTVGTLFLVLFLFSTASAQKMQFGKFSANEKSANYVLHKNEGNRVYTMEVEFKTPCDTKPDILISVNQVDASNGSNLRFKVVAKAISRDNFIIEISTWSDSKIYGIGGTWMAIEK